MARPPRISRDRVVEVAINLLDNEGIPGLSLDRIAAELGVRGPSLYHYYADKSAILDDVAAHILGTIVVDRKFEDVEDWLVGICLELYRRVSAHPNVTYLLLEHLPPSAVISGFGLGARLVATSGVPVERQLLLLEGVQHIAWGFIMYRAIMGPTPFDAEELDAHRWIELGDACRAAPWKDEQMLEQALRTFIAGVLDGVR